MTTPDRWRPFAPLVLLLFGYAFLMRVLPYALHRWGGMPIEGAFAVYPWNFNPLYALALLGGAAFPRWAALLVPMAVQFAADLAIAAIAGPAWAFYTAQPFILLAFAATAACGLPLRGRVQPLPTGIAAVAGAVAFFVVSNFGVWLTDGGWSHGRSLAGLVACFADAVPFFPATLLSVALFVPIVFLPARLFQSLWAGNHRAPDHIPA